uniref:hypothetical protein n=1 Tax=Erwinia amylovora TaxID=552 RepID=UPI00159EC750|nr:hypothetical protein [Erwinia amylovora]
MTARRCEKPDKQGFQRGSALKVGAIHPAAWLCNPGKFIGRKRGGLPSALLPVLPSRLRIRAEPARSGAGNGSYGKSNFLYHPSESIYAVLLLRCSHFAAQKNYYIVRGNSQQQRQNYIGKKPEVVVVFLVCATMQPCRKSVSRIKANEL